MACVYMHTVKVNGKRYIGQSINNPETRWGSNGYRYKSQLFYYAIQKYGWDNIEHEILADNLTQKEADALEKYYIKLYQTNKREYGYNIASGGKDGGAGLCGEKNPMARAVMCIETGKVWPCANDCLREINMSMGALQSSLYQGYRCDGLHYKYIDDTNYVPNKGPLKVICVETGQIWESAKACAEELGVNKRNIFRYCNHTRKPKNGLTFEYYVA